ncbi:hypothetical protein [Viridibacterium curvum]|uniref:RCC1 domain-containing protein n=1 Tax=Viridibacterium curvum TaxID=1101404 RepID=UPI0031E54C51
MPSVVTGVSSVTRVAAGSGGSGGGGVVGHVCAVKSDSTVICWGSNSLNQLGTGNTVASTPPVPADGSPASSSTPVTVKIQPSKSTTATLSGAVAVSAGLYHACALLADGKIYCWGDNSSGALGTTTTSPWPTWSAQTGATLVDGISGAVQLSSGSTFNCALLNDGTVRCWGDNTYGQIGNGTKTGPVKTPYNPGLSNVISVMAGNTHACAMLSSGDVKCWGANGYGQIGDNSTVERLTPTSTSAGAVFAP